MPAEVVAIDVPQARSWRQWSNSGAGEAVSTSVAGRQAVLSALMRTLEDDEGPTYFSYPTFRSYLAKAGDLGDIGDFTDTLKLAAKKMLAVVGEDVYMADSSAYVRGSLAAEFPELALFRLDIESDAFVESAVCPGIWVETRRFADLRSLSRMRRELKKTGVANGLRAVEVVSILLGLDELIGDQHQPK